MEQTELEIVFEMREKQLTDDINRLIETLSKYKITEKHSNLDWIISVSQEITRDVSALMTLQQIKFWSTQK